MHQNEFLKSLSLDALDVLQPCLLPVEFTRGQFLHQSDARMIFPSSGLFSTLVNFGGLLVTVGVIGAESHVGEAEPIEGCAQGRSWKVLVNGQGFGVNTRSLGDIFEKHPAIKETFANQAAQRLLDAQRECARRTAALADARLALCLLDLGRKLRQSEIPLHQDDLAEILGIQRTTVCGAAVRLRSAGLIRYRRGSLKIVDEAGLAAASRPDRGANGKFDRLQIDQNATGPIAQAVQFG